GAFAPELLGRGELDHLGVLQYLAEVSRGEVEELAGFKGLGARRRPHADLSPDDVTPVNAWAHVVGQALVVGAWVIASGQVVVSRRHSTQLADRHPHAFGGMRWVKFVWFEGSHKQA